MEHPLDCLRVTEEPQKSIDCPTNCFKAQKIKSIARCLAFASFVPVPLALNTDSMLLYPIRGWKDLTIHNLNLDTLFSAAQGIAIKTGEASSLIVIDVDYPEKFNNEFYPLEKLIEEAPYVVQSKSGGYHFGFLYDPDFPQTKIFLDQAGFELKSNGALINFYAIPLFPELEYKHIKLEPLRPMPRELKEKILELIAKQKEIKSSKKTPKWRLRRPKDLDIREIIELASEVYRKDHRQDWTIYTAAYLRKCGFSFEETKEALEEFLRSQGDEEIPMRIAGIEHTFEKPIEDIKGLRGLLELGLSEETYLILRGYRAQRGEGIELRSFTLSDLLTLQTEEPSWLIPNLLPEGFSLLGGRPKMGKSWLALQIALTCIQLGKKVVHFALEDTPKRLINRLKKLGIHEVDKTVDYGLYFFFELPRIGKGAIKTLRACIQQFKPNLIIIDPWVKIKPQISGKDVFLEEYQALDVLKEISQGVSILLVHHTRKTQSEDPLDEILGSTGQTAVVDSILVLKRGRGSKTAALYVIPRDFEECSWGLRFEDGWKLEGSAKDVMLAEEQKRIVEAIRTLESMGEKATIKAIAELTSKSQGAVKVALFDLVQKGVVYRKDRGVYSLLDNIKDTKRANLTNLTNLTNFTNFLTFSPPTPSLLVSPDDEKVRKVSSEIKNELTILSQNLQDLEEKVRKVSKVSSNDQNVVELPDPAPAEEKETVFLLMPEKCPICGCEVWQVDKDLYERNKSGVGSCAKCRHLSWFGNFAKGKVLSKADVEYFLTDLPS